MNKYLRFPLYAKFALITVAFIGLFYILFIGQAILLPLIYAIVIAIVLNPFVNFLVRKKIGRKIAITITVTVAIFILILLLFFIFSQLSLFSDSYPQLKLKFNAILLRSVNWVSLNFNIKTSVIYNCIKENETSALNNLGGTIGQTISTMKNILIIVVLIPVYVFMILFYKPLLLEFLHKLFHPDQQLAAAEILSGSKKIIQGYLTGLLFEALIIATLNSVGLLIIGIDYAIILGILGALLNVIPYIGGVIAIGLPMLIAFITKETLTYPILVLIVYTLIQFVDNHIIIPNIVASKVKINALVCIIVVLFGGAIWGIPGMFLSIPLTAILKVTFDHIEALKPWGYLLGNIETTKRVNLKFVKKIKLKLP